MRKGKSLLCAAVMIGIGIIARAQMAPAEPESVYAPPAPPRENEGVNEGAVHLDLLTGYFTDHMHRGIETFELPQFNIDPNGQPKRPGAEDTSNLQVDMKISFDLGKLPHPFVGVFVNTADSDPISTFEEIRPSVGIDWPLRPLLVSIGHDSYLYPDRDTLETSEIWVRITLDDSYFLHTEKPIFSPYVYGAYDYDLYNGWYFEAGVSHDFVIEDTGLTITAQASASYVRGFELFDATAGLENADGFQHYQLGLIADYSLNTLLNLPQRYGEWSFVAFGYYTDGIEDNLIADTQIWGGAGIRLRY